MNPWVSAWSRAVVVPAWRRAAGVWVGAGIGGGIVFGPTGMHPSDLTQLALHVPAVGAGLALMWLLVFVPSARVIMRGLLPSLTTASTGTAAGAAGNASDGVAYLYALPHSRLAPWLVGGAALLALQLPWLALWVAGDGARGLAIVVAISAAIALVAKWRPRARPVRMPRWTRPGRARDGAALRGVYLRALRRRASDALVRAAGLSILGGLVAALIVRNNGLVDAGAGVLGAGTIAIVLLPGWVGALLPLVEAQRSIGWLALSLGMSAATRVGVLAMVVAAIYIVTTLVAVAAAAIAFAAVLDTSTVAYLAVCSVGVAVGLAMIATRAVVMADRDARSAAVRVVTGAITASAVAIVCVGWLGITGIGVLAAVGATALLTARSS